MSDNINFRPIVTPPQVPLREPLDLAKLYKTTPPPFGHAMLEYFLFSPGYINFNHGSIGSQPAPVRAFCDAMTSQIEANPDIFITYNYWDYLAQVRVRLAKLLGAELDECITVHNTSHGVATFMRNFIFNQGDFLIGTTTTFNSVAQTLKYLADIPPKPTLFTFNLQFPTTHAEIIKNWRAYLQEVKSIEDPTGNRKIVAVVDGICSHPGVLLPWEEMVKICREEGVLSVVDGAHLMGQQLNINLSETKPDFWVSNGHKWLTSKRGSALIYVPKRNQHYIKSPIPTPAAYLSPHDENYTGPQDFVTLFKWNGTIDYVPQLSLGAALDFREWLGGEEAINGYIHPLALAGGKRLAEILGTTVMDPDGELTLNMVNVELPLSGDIKATDAVTAIYNETMLIQYNVSSAFFKHNGRWWVRCSTQMWHEMSDFEYIGTALLAACANIKDYVLKNKGN